jgi:hypothetical protein
LENVPTGEYFAQILWDQNLTEPGIDDPGNIYSEKQRITIDQPENLSFILSEKIEDRIIMLDERFSTVRNITEFCRKCNNPNI